ncbi:MAG: DUF1127 domain-containing protein [Acetobacteraceae bacterium]
MSAPIAKSQIAFELPKLSYVDARLEEPNLLQRPMEQPKQGFGAWIAGRISALARWNRDHEQAAELYSMTDRELMDMGLSRGDIPGVVSGQYSKELNEARGLIG